MELQQLLSTWEKKASNKLKVEEFYYLAPQLLRTNCCCCWFEEHEFAGAAGGDGEPKAAHSLEMLQATRHSQTLNLGRSYRGSWGATYQLHNCAFASVVRAQYPSLRAILLLSMGMLRTFPVMGHPGQLPVLILEMKLSVHFL